MMLSLSTGTESKDVLYAGVGKRGTRDPIARTDCALKKGGTFLAEVFFLQKDYTMIVNCDSKF